MLMLDRFGQIVDALDIPSRHKSAALQANNCMADFATNPAMEVGEGQQFVHVSNALVALFVTLVRFGTI